MCIYIYIHTGLKAYSVFHNVVKLVGHWKAAWIRLAFNQVAVVTTGCVHSNTARPMASCNAISRDPCLCVQFCKQSFTACPGQVFQGKLMTACSLAGRSLAQVYWLPQVLERSVDAFGMKVGRSNG